MADKIFSSSESSPESARPIESAHVEGQKNESKEIRERSKGFIEGVSDVVDGAEMAEVVDGEVVEATGEDKKNGSQGTPAGKGHAVPATGKVNELPTIEIMRIQIATQIKSEVRILEKEVALLLSNGNFSPYKLNDVISRVRSLQHILVELAYASAEMLKDWWMKFVKGITA